MGHSEDDTMVKKENALAESAITYKGYTCPMPL